MIGGKGIFILLSLSFFGLGLLGYSQKPPFSKKLNSAERVSSLFTTSVRKLPLIEPNCLRQDDFILPQYKQPEAVALYQQALHFEKNGRGISLEEKESNIFRLLTLSSEKGYWMAKVKLAAMYMKGKRKYSIGIPQDIKKSIKLYEELVAEEIPYGYFMMAELLANGEHISGNKRKSLAYFDKAYAMGSPNAQYAIANQYNAASVYYIDKDLYMENTYLNQYVKYHQCAGQQGFTSSLYELAMTTIVASKNTPKALRYYQKAAMLGHGKSMYAMYSILGNDSNDGFILNPKLLKCINDKMELLDNNPLLTFPNLDKECPLPLHPILGDGMQYPDKHREPGFMQRVKSFGYPTNDPND